VLARLHGSRRRADLVLQLGAPPGVAIADLIYQERDLCQERLTVVYLIN